MRKFVACTLFALALGACTPLSTTSNITAAQAQAGAEYLETSVASLQTALDAAKTTGDAAKIAAAQVILDQAKKAAATFKATTTQTDWSFARSLLSTAVSVAAPIAVRALVSGS